MIARHAIASLVVLSGLLAATYATARPIRNVHAVSEYTGIERLDVVTSNEVGGSVMQPGTSRPVSSHRLIIAKGNVKLWKCGEVQQNAIGGSFRACEWEVVK